METKLIEKVSEVISAIKSAKHVVEVVCAIHSLALHLFPLDSSLPSGSVDQRYREQVLSAKVPSEEKRRPCFLLASLFHLFSKYTCLCVFFVDGLATEVVQTLVPCLHQNAIDDHDVNSVHSNTESFV
ncbi:hypothetical protein RGQ29_004353 [Quercus rubra]|uniref:Uncharacterized protein n=1 Tax=Quercus rubra TaxID=3512 RepID=A0AAN7IFM7_QUERU|nr:hypothetical protein RGQ29_004353 [Quercus rubra]